MSGPTAFPVGASGTRRGGTVALEVDVGADGTVMDAMVVDSSGSRVLDRAAVDSARSHWKFAAQECSDNARLSHSYIVVHFRTKPAYTFSAMRAPEYRREVHDASAPGCTMSTGSGETVVVSCIVDGESHTRIAER
ncbi:MAG TPA: energy transducer TonB [Steroidobacter sp.]|nr:energy transducer TonB [Steroidobacter sp.]